MTVGATSDLLKGIPYFRDLAPGELERIRQRVLVKSYEKGEIIFLERGKCEGLYFVESGHVKVFKTSADGKEQVLRVMQAGDPFNDVPVFDGGPNPASAEALENSVVFLIPKRDLLEWIQEHPLMAMGVIRVLASRLRHLTMLVEDLSFRHETSRLAKVLLEYADATHGAPKRRLTQQEMASLIGTAREVVGRSLKSLEEQGIVRLEGHKIVIVDRAALTKLV